MALNKKSSLGNNVGKKIVGGQAKAPKDPYISTMTFFLKQLEFLNLIPNTESKIILEQYKLLIASKKYKDPVLYALDKRGLNPEEIPKMDTIIIKLRGKKTYIDWRNNASNIEEFLTKNERIKRIIKTFSTPIFNVEASDIFTIVGLTQASTDISANFINKLWLETYGKSANIGTALIDPVIWNELMNKQLEN